MSPYCDINRVNFTVWFLISTMTVDYNNYCSRNRFGRLDSNIALLVIGSRKDQ